MLLFASYSFSVSSMGALQTSQCFLDSTCSVCGTLDGAFPGAWVSTMCVNGSNDELKAALSVKISPNTDDGRITEDLYICGIDVFDSMFNLLCSLKILCSWSIDKGF